MSKRSRRGVQDHKHTSGAKSGGSRKKEDMARYGQRSGVPGWVWLIVGSVLALCGKQLVETVTQNDEGKRDKLARRRVKDNVLVNAPDVRHPKCREAEPEYIHDPEVASLLPHMSIIIPYLGERWRHVLLSVRSITHSTNMNLVDEIIFIDDANEPKYNYTQELLMLHDKIKVISNPERYGVTKSKYIGAQAARAEVIVFLEPHILVVPGWEYPLLTALKQDPKTLAQPLVDAILDTEFVNINAARAQISGFDWSLTHLWREFPEHRDKKYQEPDPYPSPSSPGGIMAVSRDFFLEIGGYDPEMREWGGENTELSLRFWQCGGKILMFPCSRVAHWFRSAEHQPYDVNLTVVVRNKKRAGLVWLDDHIEKFYQLHERDAANKVDSRRLDVGDISDRIAHRDRMQCKGMDWYIDNVYPELRVQPLQLPLQALSGKPHYRVKNPPMKVSYPKVTALADLLADGLMEEL